MKVYISYEEKKNVKDEVIDIKPHAPYGTKAARKAAKERAAERYLPRFPQLITPPPF